LAQKKSKKNITRSTEATQIAREVESDPMKHERGRPKGGTLVHNLPIELRVEVDGQLQSGIPVPAVAAWLVRKGQVDEKGNPKITEAMLYYYREHYVTAYEIVGGEFVSRWMTSLGVRIDPLLTIQTAIAKQIMRVEIGLHDELKRMDKDGKPIPMILPYVGEELDRLDRLTARAFRMMQDMGILPRAPLEVKSTAHSTIQGAMAATITQQGSTPVPPNELQRFEEAVARGFLAMGVDLGAQELPAGEPANAGTTNRDPTEVGTTNQGAAEGGANE